MTITNSNVAMVRISGEKLRSIREQQELTQLYLATAVEVTTETISRWERSGTPNIKRENGQKLATALQVELDELLADVDPVPAGEQKERGPVPQNLKKAKRLLFFVLFLGLVSALFFFFRPHPVEQHTNIYSLRTMPSHVVPGQIFPVRIQIEKPGDKSASYLVNESIPEGCEVVAVSPKATVQNDHLLKWINRKGGYGYFTYAARIIGGKQKKVRFSGTLKVGQSMTGEIAIQGNDSIQLLSYHWADRDKDNSISDEEMLAVYDDFPGMETLPVNIELVEEMWMGTRYIWNPDKNKFIISP